MEAVHGWVWIFSGIAHSKLGCLLFSTGSSNSSTPLVGGDGEGKALFFPFQMANVREALA